MKQLIVWSICFLFVLTTFVSCFSCEVIKNIFLNENNEYYQMKASWDIPHLPITFHQQGENRQVCGNSNPSHLRNGGPMNSSWPMQSHDLQHTGLSQYYTTNNPGIEIWHIRGGEAGGIQGSSAIIDKNDTIYFCTQGGDSSLHAVYKNGTKKWRFITDGTIWSTPAIADDGTIYVGTTDNHLYAITSNGTLQWMFSTGMGNFIESSPVIGPEGTIYFGCDNNKIYAVNPNGTEKWHYTTGYFVASSPAIGQDGIIYVGSGDYFLYALYNNGTLRWKFGTGDYVQGDPSIAQDGTIYAPSFDGYLYALYPNGTMKWKATTGSSIAAAGVALASDGTIYVGTELLRAYYPNGTLKWSYNFNAGMWGTVPAVSADGTIFISGGGHLIAVNPNGIERWRCLIDGEYDYSSPCIGADGTVYVGTTWSDYGYLHAIGKGPLKAEANGPYTGQVNASISFTGTIFGGTLPYTYLWNFGDGKTSNEQNPTHNYTHVGNYTATFTVTDKEGNQSTDNASVSIYYPPPAITIIKPKNALYILNIKTISFSLPVIIGRLTITAEVIPEPIGVDHVEFWINKFYEFPHEYTVTTPPYSITWGGIVKPGMYEIRAFVYDKAQHSSETSIAVFRLI